MLNRPKLIQIVLLYYSKIPGAHTFIHQYQETQSSLEEQVQTTRLQCLIPKVEREKNYLFQLGKSSILFTVVKYEKSSLAM